MLITPTFVTTPLATVTLGILTVEKGDEGATVNVYVPAGTPDTMNSPLAFT